MPGDPGAARGKWQSRVWGERHRAWIRLRSRVARDCQLGEKSPGRRSAEPEIRVTAQCGKSDRQCQPRVNGEPDTRLRAAPPSHSLMSGRTAWSHRSRPESY
ncbi:hypothetical protein NDU88_002058 [Pleurodeles waltl]|uniref:Uncharacterized protein n=1 Tax=Pleurodeles waltl TaxID=8319 RepID=A0AAV7TK26_PLEWA|nr:hypothetical protein NDU88_002058 [Pleurodeles waltl]